MSRIIKMIYYEDKQKEFNKEKCLVGFKLRHILIGNDYQKYTVFRCKKIRKTLQK